MLKGVHLTLMIGPTVPVPAPQPVIDALTGVVVTNGKESSAFQLTFEVGKKSLLLQSLLPAGYLDPMSTRVIIVVTVNGVPNVLVDGIVTRQELTPSNDPGQSKLTVTGEDLKILMDVMEVPFMRYPATPEVGRIYSILGKYAYLGIVPSVVPPTISEIPNVTERIPTHKGGTDLGYIKWMADAVGYVFYIEPGPLPGQSIAYFGPDIRIPVPQPALNVNMDVHTNVESISFSLNGLAKKTMIYMVLDPFTGKIPIPVPVPDISILRPPLGARLTPPAKIMFANDAAKLTAQEAAQQILSRMAKSASEAVSASGSLDVTRYGRILKSRMLAGVRGASLTYDGLYYVDSVTHTIKRGEYKQQFQLSRNGLVSLTPVVPV